MNIKLEKLIKQFAKLPRIGNRAATRVVLSLLQDKTGKAVALANSLLDTVQTIHPCPVCGVLTDKEVCEYCSNIDRQNGQLCIVRDLSDVLVLENSGVFSGRYHVLGGNLSGIDGITPNDLNISTIQNRIKNERITEVIFALPNTIDGKTTQQYIISVLNNEKITYSELASGIPLGGDLDYLDDGTLTLAFGGRKKI